VPVLNVITPANVCKGEEKGKGRRVHLLEERKREEKREAVCHLVGGIAGTGRKRRGEERRDLLCSLFFPAGEEEGEKKEIRSQK